MLVPVGFYLYVPSTGDVYRAILAAGTTFFIESTDQFLPGDRNDDLQDSRGSRR